MDADQKETMATLTCVECGDEAVGTVADPAALDRLQLRLNEDGKLEQISS